MEALQEVDGRKYAVSMFGIELTESADWNLCLDF
jgi:hypothetical protein